jgi:hypothetical protein
MLKLIALLSAAIPLILFVRALIGQRPSKLGAAWREAKTQVDLGITIFLVIIGCVLAFTIGKLAWGWWMAH